MIESSNMPEEQPEENWYVLFVLAPKQEQISQLLCERGLKAFVPKMEYYRRDSRETAVKPMFPGYIFIRTALTQTEFDRLLAGLGDQKDGMIRQLKEEGASALRKEEQEYFMHLLDEDGVAKMSLAYLKKGKAKVTEGPLAYFEDHIVKVDKHNRAAWLDLEFMDRRIMAGLTIMEKEKPQPDGKRTGNDGGAGWEKQVQIEGQTVDLEELTRKMMG